MQKAHVPAMIDQIWAGCVRCGEHATLACVLRNSQYTQFVNIRERLYPMTLSFIRWCHEMHSGMFRSNSFTSLLSIWRVKRPMSCRFSSFACELFNLFKKARGSIPQGQCLRQVFSMRDGRFRGKNNVRVVVFHVWFELILSTSPFL